METNQAFDEAVGLDAADLWIGLAAGELGVLHHGCVNRMRAALRSVRAELERKYGLDRFAVEDESDGVANLAWEASRCGA